MNKIHYALTVLVVYIIPVVAGLGLGPYFQPTLMAIVALVVAAGWLGMLFYGDAYLRLSDKDSSIPIKVRKRYVNFVAFISIIAMFCIGAAFTSPLYPYHLKTSVLTF